MSHLNHYKVTTPSGSTTVLQLSEETAKRDYPSAVLIGDAAATPDLDPDGKAEGQKQAGAPKNKSAVPPQNKSGD